MTPQQESAFSELSRRWLSHLRLRRADASVGELYASRVSLEEARRVARDRII